MHSSNRHRVFIIATSIILIFILAFIDYLTGEEISLSIFYLFPITLIAWCVGKWQAFAVSFYSAVMWFFADLATGHVYSHPIIVFWNTSVRLSFFLLNSYFIAEIKSGECPILL